MGERREGQVAAGTERMHFVGKFNESSSSTTTLMHQKRGSVHTEWTINRLAARGTMAPHLPESGITTPSRRTPLFPGDSRDLNPCGGCGWWRRANPRLVET